MSETPRRQPRPPGPTECTGDRVMAYLFYLHIYTDPPALLKHSPTIESKSQTPQIKLLITSAFDHGTGYPPIYIQSASSTPTSKVLRTCQHPSYLNSNPKLKPEVKHQDAIINLNLVLHPSAPCWTDASSSRPSCSRIDLRPSKRGRCCTSDSPHLHPIPGLWP
jgi:hypothetical protein